MVTHIGLYLCGLFVCANLSLRKIASFLFLLSSLKELIFSSVFSSKRNNEFQMFFETDIFWLGSYQLCSLHDSFAWYSRGRVDFSRYNMR